VITLQKGQEPADLGGITKMAIGVSWDASSGNSGGLLGRLKKKVGTDLDLIAIAMRGNDPVRLAGLDSLDPMGNGSVIHSGDNQTGRGAGDDETVTVTFQDIPAPVTSIIFIASAFKKYSSFADARNISFKVYDSSGGATQVVADIWPSLLGKDNANAVAKAVRTPNGWTLEVLDIKGKISQGDDQSLMRFAVGK
jgi:stress response protein SCP2